MALGIILVKILTVIEMLFLKLHADNNRSKIGATKLMKIVEETEYAEISMKIPY